MRTLKRSINKAEVGGEPLPPAFAAFERAGIILRRAEITMIAGTPGAGKSSIALAIAARAKVPTLYFSADTNAHTMAMRLVAMSSHISQQAAEQLLKRDPKQAEEVLVMNNHLFWSFESTPTLKDLDEEVSAFETVWGRSPTLIVVDNLMDIAMDGHEVLTIGQMKQGDETYLCVAPVKNRYGRADQTGNNYVSLAFNPDNMYLDDVQVKYMQETVYGN